ncbi:MAG: peptide ABC transporter ATP-binding protein, partial [Lachnospiraceae bacterium]|nr:peptide ABC transporter ATP-binding protein [Lachnospiraceae bacterium]
TGSFFYAFLSFLLPVPGILAAQIFKRKRYYRNYKACRKGAVIGFVLFGVILLLFLLLLLLAVI